VVHRIQVRARDRFVGSSLMPSLSWFGTGVSEAFQFIEDRLEHFPYRLVNVKPAAGVFDIGGFRESEFRVGQQDDHYGCEYHATADN
jgi:hypothetical protein